MSSDIEPLTSVSSSPLVRERRHYPGDQKKQQQQKQQQQLKEQEQNASEDVQTEPEVDNVEQQKDVDIDEKNVRVKHIDEYA